MFFFLFRIGYKKIVALFTKNITTKIYRKSLTFYIDLQVIFVARFFVKGS